jgi:glyoxylate/hydroxypyruvate reductase
MAILVRTSAKSLGKWRPPLAAALPGRDVRFFPEIGDPAEIDTALVWQPQSKLLSGLPNLKLIVCLGAGVDAIIADPTFPRHLPVVRLVDPYMTAAMSEYVAFQVLRLHRQDLDYAAQQRHAEWREHPQKNAAERPVGILGFGTLGQDAGRKLKAIGFDVAGWSRSAKDVAGVPTYAGPAGFDRILARSEILVALLPLTRDTEGLLDASPFARLPRGAAIVNAGRGRTLVEPDLLAALDSGQISAAILDVFQTEPLPPDHPFWHHPRIVVTPHIAADTHPATAIAAVVTALREFESGLPLTNRVDLTRGY